MSKQEIKVFYTVIKMIPLVCYYSISNLILRWLPKKYFQKNISGQTVLITGAGSGIGRELAIQFSKHATQLVMVDLNKESLFETQKMLDGSSRAFLFQCDVSKREKVYEMAKIINNQIGKVDILVNNAGIVSGKYFIDLLDDEILKTIEVNTLAHFWLLKAFLPNMITSNKGHIVSVASQAGLGGYPRLTDYCCSKFAAVGLMEALQRELESQGLRGVKTTTVCPSLVSTGLFQGAKKTLTEILKPKDVALLIMDAVLEDKDLLLIPQWSYIMFMLKWMMPSQIAPHFYKEVGLKNFMSTFTGRPKINLNSDYNSDVLNGNPSLKNGKIQNNSNQPD